MVGICGIYIWGLQDVGCRLVKGFDGVGIAMMRREKCDETGWSRQIACLNPAGVFRLDAAMTPV
jgi:hypothetical protein